MRRAKARSAEICRPDDVTCVFQVSRYKVEPRERRFCRNLFSKQNCRLAGLDELEPDRPEVAVVIKATLLTRA